MWSCFLKKVFNESSTGSLHLCFLKTKTMKLKCFGFYSGPTSAASALHEGHRCDWGGRQTALFQKDSGTYCQFEMLLSKCRSSKPLCSPRGPENLTPGLSNYIRALHEMVVAGFYLLVMERGVKNIHISLLPKDIWIRVSHFHGERPKQLTREYPEVVLSLLQLFLA